MVCATLCGGDKLAPPNSSTSTTRYHDSLYTRNQLHNAMKPKNTMKRLSEKSKRNFARKARRGKGQWSNARQEQKSHRLPSTARRLTLHGVEAPVAVLGQGLIPPDILCIDNNREEVLKFLTTTRSRLDSVISHKGHRKALKYRHHIVRSYWDFTKINWITPTVALMIAAEYDRATSLMGGQRFAALDRHQWKPSVRNVMQQVGFFDLLEIDKRGHATGSTERSGPVWVLKMRSAAVADSSVAGGLIEELEILTLKLSESSEVDFGRLYGALFEGIANVKNHAYPANFAVKHDGRWWATGSVDTKSRVVSAIIYDQGVTIPGSLPNSQMAEGIRRLFGSTTDWLQQDDRAIAGAMEVARSSTGKAHRGLGLAEMEAFMETCTAGRLRILSRNGEYISEVEGGRKSSRSNTYKSPLGGTLVQWDVTV